LLLKIGKPVSDVTAAPEYLQHLVEPLDRNFYGPFEDQARERLRGCDEKDWPVLASA
jgi:hypothetical protein